MWGSLFHTKVPGAEGSRQLRHSQGREVEATEALCILFLGNYSYAGWESMLGGVVCSPGLSRVLCISRFSVGLHVALTAMFIYVLGMSSAEMMGSQASAFPSVSLSPAVRGLQHFTENHVIVKF